MCTDGQTTVTYCNIGLKSKGTFVEVPTPKEWMKVDERKTTKAGGKPIRERTSKEWMKVNEKKNNQNWQKAK